VTFSHVHLPELLNQRCEYTTAVVKETIVTVCFRSRGL